VTRESGPAVGLVRRAGMFSGRLRLTWYGHCPKVIPSQFEAGD